MKGGQTEDHMLCRKNEVGRGEKTGLTWTLNRACTPQRVQAQVQSYSLSPQTDELEAFSAHSTVLWDEHLGKQNLIYLIMNWGQQ